MLKANLHNNNRDVSYVLILSRETDESTNKVIQWLNYLEEKVIRVNYESNFALLKMYLNNDEMVAEIEVDNEKYTTGEVKSFWYRRGEFRNGLEQNYEICESLKKTVINHLTEELTELRGGIHYLLERKKHLNSTYTSNMNKIKMLLLAKEVGLEIPSTLICQNKKDLQKFSRKSGPLITKGIQNGATFTYFNETTNESEQYGLYTTEVGSEFIDSAPEEYLYTCFQEKLAKALDLRVFIMEKEVYSMAIFSQNNPKTEVDFRDYDRETPNRNVPFRLPEEIEIKLLELMEKLGLNCGSADIVLTGDGRYVFLEVNPIGQFGMVSHPCNYHLEKRIAEYLSHVPH